MAREIARIVGATKREEGYFEGGGYAVTWAFGHLVQLAMPDGYGIRGFVRDNLPVIPETFTLIPRQTKTEKGYKPDSGVTAQIKVIARLFNGSEQIVVATDAGREGELIFRYLYHYIGCSTPFVRLWISSLTDKAIREGLRNLENGSKYDNLFLAAKARSESDWLVGINGTQALKGCSITEGKTKPKPLHTEATLLSAMETAGKEIEDDALRQALKDCGIGTPATRAAIIETLFKRGYMERCKKSLVPTEKGLALYSVVKTMRIADVALTGEWEKELARIERGELPADTFRKEIETYTREITSELLSCDKLFAHKDSGCKCPKCGTGTMQFYGKVVRCDNAECGLPVFRLKANRTLSDEEIKDLLTEGHTKLLKGFKSKQGKSFDAIVAFDGEFNTTFVFPEKKATKKFSGRKK